MATQKTQRRVRIKRSIRAKIAGTMERPRLSVFRGNSSIYAQLIDDTKGITLVAVSSVELTDKKSINADTARQVGVKLAEKAKEKGIQSIVFDRNGYLYHGKLKSLAEGARESGLLF